MNHPNPLPADYLDYPLRRQGMDHDRYDWSVLPQRPPVAWPGGARIALWVTVSLQWLSPEQFALEHFPLDQTLTAVLRALPGAECDPADARQWRVPFAAHATLKQVPCKLHL